MNVTPEMVAAVKAAKCDSCGAFPYEDCKRHPQRDCGREFRGGSRVAGEIDYGPLVNYFRGDGYNSFGWNGDARKWSAERTAIEAMKELERVRSGVR